MAVVDDAIEDRVGKRGLGEVLVPLRDRELAVMPQIFESRLRRFRHRMRDAELRLLRSATGHRQRRLTSA